jgi:hypothetical protein
MNGGERLDNLSDYKLVKKHSNYLVSLLRFSLNTTKDVSTRRLAIQTDSLVLPQSLQNTGIVP